MRYLDVLKETVRSGTIASLVMMPPGFLFKALGLRVGHYGPKLSEVLFGSTAPALLFAQHMVIGWLSALPLLLALPALRKHASPVVAGALYGVAYYVAVNSLLLPWIFSDPTPWRLGADFIYPSLIVHMVFGASIGFTARRFRWRVAEGT